MDIPPTPSLSNGPDDDSSAFGNDSEGRLIAEIHAMSSHDEAGSSESNSDLSSAGSEADDDESKPPLPQPAFL